MDTPSDADITFLLTALAPLTGPLYSALDRASEIAAAHFADFGMDSAEYQPCESHLTRAHARRLLKAEEVGGELGPWRVAAPQPNVQICLANELLRLRLLRPDGLTVPKAGPNASRIAYYSNYHAHLQGIAGSTLIGLWAPDDTGELRVQIVRTIGTERYSGRVPVDIKLWLPRVADDLADLEFRPSDADMDIQLPFEATDDDTGNGQERETGDDAN